MKPRKKQGSARPFYIALGALAILGIVALVWVANRPGSQAAVRTVDPMAVTGQAQPQVLGDSAAPVVIMEWADFECVWCGQFAVMEEPDVRRQLIETGLARFEFYDYPIPGHRNAWPAAHAAACAADQGKFWEMHDQIFRMQQTWARERDASGQLEQYARALGLNMEEWERCYDERRHQARIEANVAEGMRRGVKSTPTFVIGNKMLEGMQTAATLRAYVDSARAAASANAPAGGGTR